MPWKETGPLEQRVQFVSEWRKGEASMAALCRAFGIGRPTGYKWVERYFEDGDEGDVRALEDRPRRPLESPHAVDADRADARVRARKLHPHWGPRKLRVWLSREWPRVLWPAPSTIGEILKRHGLVPPRRRRRRTPPSTQPFAACAEPNAVWCVDFKGQFRLCSRELCYPLTMSDAFSRFLLRCEGIQVPDTLRARPIFESAFREFGLPKAIRSDNGAPFASTAVGGLTPLSVWWIKLGIFPERIDPGKPQQNGRHERMHRTLKQETASPPKETFRAQQRAFDLFRRRYNEERPHEALGQVPPATRYEPSARPYTGDPLSGRPPTMPSRRSSIVRARSASGAVATCSPRVFGGRRSS